MILQATGLNHRSASLPLREKVAVGMIELPRALEQLMRHGLSEGLILSTCNRTEIYSVQQDESEPFREYFLQEHGISEHDFDRYFYRHRDDLAAGHLFRVASSLDSMVLGEAEVLGQVKRAYQTASEAGTVGKILNGLFQRSFAVAKRVRHQTRLGQLPTSVGSVAAKLVKQIFGANQPQAIMMLGAGEIAEATLRYLRDEASRVELTVCNRTLDKAVQLAAAHGGIARPLEEMDLGLDRADIIICSLSCESPVISRERIAALPGIHSGRPKFFIDLGVPRNIAPEISEFEDVYLYDMDDLKRIAEENLEARAKLVEECEPYIAAGLEEFQHWIQGLDSHALIGEVHTWRDSLLDDELSRCLRRIPELGDRERAEIRAFGKRLLGKALHHPLRALREERRESDTPFWKKFFFGD